MAVDSSDHSSPATSDLGESNPTAPSLTRLGLSLLLLVVVTLPPTLVLSLWWILPSPQESRLPAEVFLTTANSSPNVTVTNRSENTISNLEINLNGAFHHYAANPLPAEETITVPLAAFIRKNGLRFDPEKTEIRKLGLYARLSDGARGVLVLQGEEIAVIRIPPPRNRD